MYVPIDVAYDHTVKLENGELHTNQKTKFMSKEKKIKIRSQQGTTKKNYRVYRLDQTTDELQITV